MTASWKPSSSQQFDTHVSSILFDMLRFLKHNCSLLQGMLVFPKIKQSSKQYTFIWISHMSMQTHVFIPLRQSSCRDERCCFHVKEKEVNAEALEVDLKAVLSVYQKRTIAESPLIAQTWLMWQSEVTMWVRQIQGRLERRYFFLF